MKRNLLVSTLLISTLSASSSVFASDHEDAFYAGLSFGKTTIDTGVSNLTGTAAVDDDDTGYKVFAGYNYSENIAVEFHYADLGEAVLSGNNGDTFDIGADTFAFTANDVKLRSEGSSVGIAGVFKLPVNDSFTPFARLGLHHWDIDSTISSSAGNANLNSNGTDFFWGIGAEVKVTESVALRAEYESFDFDGDDIELLSVGVTYMF